MVRDHYGIGAGCRGYVERGELGGVDGGLV